MAPTAIPAPEHGSELSVREGGVRSGRGDLVPVQGARAMARRIPGARLLEVDGVDHAPWFSSPDEIVGEIEELLTGTRHAPEPTRMLATVLFTDIWGSTERAAELGDSRWREVSPGTTRSRGGT